MKVLTDRGWRRSGKYCYKPDNSEMCCPLFIIRCDAPNFKASKSQKKVLKKFLTYLQSGKHVVKTTPTKSLDEATQEKKTVPEEEEKPVVKSVPRKGDGPDPSKPPCRKSKEIRQEKKRLKQDAKKDICPPQSVDEACCATASTRKTLEDLMIFPKENPSHTLEIRMVRSFPKSKEFKESLAESYKLYKKYQMVIHKDPEDKLTMKQYEQFLVDSPLIPESGPQEWEGIGYGSYHQQYYMDGRLIMVGVVDILHKCLSSKYLYYDTDYDFLSLGVVSALNEIKLTRQLHSFNPTFQYYCMGYYNHTCPKMNYKARYSPSYLLCTRTNTYVPIEQCIPKLDATKYCKLARDDVPDDSEVRPVDSYTGSTLVVMNHQVMPYHIYMAITGKEIAQIKEYCALVGPDISKGAVVVFQN